MVGIAIVRIARVTVTLTALLFSANVTAQSANENEVRARALFADGVEALDRNEPEAALMALRASLELRPRPIVVLNIAQALRAAGRTVEAIAAYEQYLAFGAAEIPAERAATVRDTLTFLRRSLGQLTVRSDPDGALLRLDGRLAGTTPLSNPLSIAGGTHTIELEHGGYVAVRERVDVVPGRRLSLRFVLANNATASTLRIAVDGGIAARAQVAIDGMQVGAPPAMRRLEPGGHQVEIRAPGHEVYRAEVLLGSLQQRSLTVHLAPSVSVLARPWVWLASGAFVVATALVVGIAVSVAQSGARPEPYIDVPPLMTGP